MTWLLTAILVITGHKYIKKVFSYMGLKLKCGSKTYFPAGIVAASWKITIQGVIDVDTIYEF